MNKGYIFILLLVFCIKTISADGFAGNEERRNKFIAEGFGFTWKDEEIYHVDIFILNHGQPLKRTEKTDSTPDPDEEKHTDDRIAYIDHIDITLEYADFVIMFSRFLGVNGFDVLNYIQSKDKITYLYDIKNGLSIEELEKIIGKIELKNGRRFTHLINDKGNSMIIYFNDNKIETIIWHPKNPIQ